MLKAVHTPEVFNFHCLLSLTYIPLFDNGPDAEYPCTISSIEPLAHNQSRAILTEASNPENVHPSFVFQGNHKGILHPRFWMLSWTGPRYCLLCTGKTHYYKGARTECISQGHILQGPEQTIKVGVFWSWTLCGSPRPLNYSINIIPFHLKCV